MTAETPDADIVARQREEWDAMCDSQGLPRHIAIDRFINHFVGNRSATIAAQLLTAELQRDRALRLVAQVAGEADENLDAVIEAVDAAAGVARRQGNTERALRLADALVILTAVAANGAAGGDADAPDTVAVTPDGAAPVGLTRQPGETRCPVCGAPYAHRAGMDCPEVHTPAT